MIGMGISLIGLSIIGLIIIAAIFIAYYLIKFLCHGLIWFFTFKWVFGMVVGVALLIFCMIYALMI